MCSLGHRHTHAHAHIPQMKVKRNSILWCSILSIPSRCKIAAFTRRSSARINFRHRISIIILSEWLNECVWMRLNRFCAFDLKKTTKFILMALSPFIYLGIGCIVQPKTKSQNFNRHLLRSLSPHIHSLPAASVDSLRFVCCWCDFRRYINLNVCYVLLLFHSSIWPQCLPRFHIVQSHKYAW